MSLWDSLPGVIPDAAPSSVESLSLIHIWMNGLYQYARELGFEPSRSTYVNRCDLCFDIKRYLCREHPTADIGYPSYFGHSRFVQNKRDIQYPRWDVPGTDTA